MFGGWGSPPPPPSPLERLINDSPVLQGAAAQLQQARAFANGHLRDTEPWQLLCLGMLLAFVASRALALAARARRTLADKGWRQLFFGFLLDLPGVRGVVARQQASAVAKLRAGLQNDRSAAGAPPADAITTLPKEGISAAQIKARLMRKASSDVRFAEGDSRVSGAVYLSGTSHQLLLNEVYKQFSITNPMHADVFPSVRKMEAEVVAMTAALLGGGPAGDPGVCGAMTSGGTESILTAVKASRDYMAATRGIADAPEMVVAESAHAAFVKAAEYFKIRLVRVPVGPDFRLSGRAVARALSRRTVLVVASAPGFPHGVMDHVEDVAEVCRRAGVPLHVDACLGGFVLPFARDLGRPIPPFDFSVPGVTSMSVDTHKFGQAHKGTSVVLYRCPEIRRFQYTQVTEWTGGLYISPGFAGSRSGALIATAWAALVHMGRDGYVAAARGMLAAAAQFAAGVAAIPELQVVGAPEMSVVAFRSTDPGLNIYKVNDLLAARGWHLNALQRPAAVHVCFTAAHSPAVVAELVRDLGECVEGVRAHPNGGAGDGMAPLYGMAATVPDRRIVGNFLVAYQDILLEA